MGFGFWVLGLGFRVQGFGLRVLGLSVKGLGFRVWILCTPEFEGRFLIGRGKVGKTEYRYTRYAQIW